MPHDFVGALPAPIKLQGQRVVGGDDLHRSHSRPGKAPPLFPFLLAGQLTPHIPSQITVHQVFLFLRTQPWPGPALKSASISSLNSLKGEAPLNMETLMSLLNTPQPSLPTGFFLKCLEPCPILPATQVSSHI